jgi:hypothetical protein
MYCVITFNHKNYLDRGLRVLTGLPGLIFLNQNDIVLVKKTKINGLQPGF